MKQALLAGLCLLSAGLHPAPASVPVLLELFTSEGCSSCPPADDLLARLGQEQPVPGAEIIPIAWHVDYWDRLGWKDRFASPAYSQRQYAYAQARGWDQVYTPQAVIQGQDHGVGSDASRLQSLISAASKAPVPRLRVKLSRSGQGFLVKVSGALEGQPMQVALLESGLSSQVKRGENAGVTLSHGDVVRAFEPMVTLIAGKASWAVDPQTLALENGPLKAVAWQQGPDFHIFSVGQSAPLKAPIQK
jgi:hypothetical protein